MDKAAIIKLLEEHKRTLENKKNSTNSLQGNVSGYDLTVSGRWIGNLEANGENYKKEVAGALGSYAGEIDALIKKIDEVILKISEAKEA